VILLSAIGLNLIELVCLNEALDDTVRVATSGEDFHSELRVVLLQQIAKLIRLSQLALVEPVFNKLDFALLKNRLAKFHRLNLVELDHLQ